MNAIIAFMAQLRYTGFRVYGNRRPMIALHIAVTVCRIFSVSPAQKTKVRSVFSLRRQPLSSAREPAFPCRRITFDLPRLYHCSGTGAPDQLNWPDISLCLHTCQPAFVHFYRNSKFLFDLTQCFVKNMQTFPADAAAALSRRLLQAGASASTSSASMRKLTGRNPSLQEIMADFSFCIQPS